MTAISPLQISLPSCFFDVVYSRDTILHIEDKEGLYRSIYQANFSSHNTFSHK